MVICQPPLEMEEEIKFENGPRWSNFRTSWAPDFDLDLGSGHGHYYLFSSIIEYYLYIKFHRNRRNFLWTDGRIGQTDGRTVGNLTPILLGRLPKFGSRPKNAVQGYCYTRRRCFTGPRVWRVMQWFVRHLRGW